MKIKSTFFCGNTICKILSCFILVPHAAFSQPGSASSQPGALVLNYDNYIVAPTINFVRQGANGQGIKVPATGNNNTWDYDVLVNNDIYSANISYVPGNSNYFATARRKTDFIFPLGGFFIQETGYEADDQNAHQRLGRSIARQAFPLAELTGFLTDSLIISQQDVFDEGTLRFVAYPCKASSSWSSSIRASTAFQLSFAVFGLDHTPGEFVQRQTLTRTVVGWGKMRIPFEGKKSKRIDVLMVRSVFTNVDSVYLGGAPAPPELIAAFGLTQGQESHDYSYLFVRAGIDEPLISFNMNEDFSAVNFVQYDTRFADIYCGKNSELICRGGETECVPYASVTPILLQDNSVTIGECADNKVTSQVYARATILPGRDNLIASVYPNPSAGAFHLRLNNNGNSNIVIRIIDLNGKTAGQVNMRGNEISFGSTLKPGVYFAEISKGNIRKVIRLVKL